MLRIIVAVDESLVPYVFATLMALEYGYNLARGGRYQNPRDSATSLMVSIPHFGVLLVLPVAWLVLYRLVEHAVPWHVPAGWWTWPLGIVAIDLATYWMHRYHHALNLTWGIHSVHHSSEEFTMTTGGRSSVAEPLVNVISGAYLILVAPALLGIPVAGAAVGWLVKDVWGFAVHTRNIDKLGPLEWILATPSHHRVHHAINPIYDGKNFGFVTIVWDKLFGTFQPELASESPIFGTHRPPLSFHPITVAFHELGLIWRDAAATSRWRDKLRIWFMPAGWRPADVPARQFTRHENPPPPALYVVGGLQLVYIVMGCFHLASSLRSCTTVENVGYLGFLVLSTAVSGDYFERAPRYTTIETVRAVSVVAMMIGTGAWFGRPFDGVVAVLVVLAGANLIAAWVVRTRARVCRRHQARAR